MKTIYLILIATLSCLALEVRFSEKPSKFQFYPRDTKNIGHVLHNGIVSGVGADSVVVLTTRNGVTFSRQSALLSYQSDSAAFNFSTPINAELAEYGFRFFVDTALMNSADSIVSGDAYVIEGQSNAAMATSTRNEYVRSVRLSDSSWFLTTEAGWSPLPHKIIEISRIPICAINEAVPGSTISQHQSNTTPYKNHVMRANIGKVRTAVKAIFWYQGEWDAGYGAEVYYPPQFDNLYRSYMSDYTGLQKLYLVQINTWHGNGTRELREADRRIAHSYPNIEIMPAIGGLGYDGHGGYAELGRNLYGIVARDLFDSRDTVGVRSPEIQRAYYTSAAKSHIALEFDQPVFWNALKDSVVYLNEKNVLTPGYLKDYFAMNDSTWESVDSCWFEQNNKRIVLKLKAGMSARNISYMPDWYNLRGCDAMSGPVLWNSRKVPAVTFAQFPVEQPAAYDTGSISTLTLTASKTTMSIFERTSLFAVVDYVGGAKDTNHYVVFSTPDSFFVRFEKGGLVRGINPGTARIIASKNGFKDTVSITVTGSFAAVSSIRFGNPIRSIMIGDTTPVDLLGTFADANGVGEYRLDTMAALQYENGLLQIRGGIITALSASTNTKVIASFGGKLCTLQVAVPVVPTFVKRINFQGRGDSLTAITDWVIDSGVVYSAQKGFGWTSTAGANSLHTPYVSNYLRATSVANGNEYRIDCPDGNYLMRVCMTVRIWQQPGIVRSGTDTLIKNTLSHDSYGFTYDNQIYVADKRVTVTGGTGLHLNVFGGISYIVLVSDDGADLNVVAKDGAVSTHPTNTTVTENTEKGSLLALRAPKACPNPFNPSTEIRFSLPAGVTAQYALFDIRGKMVSRELLAKSHVPQMRKIAVNFNNPKQNKLSSGTYFGRLICSDGKQFVHSIVMIK